MCAHIIASATTHRNRDDDFYYRMLDQNLIEEPGTMNRPPPGEGVFFSLPDRHHTKRDKSNFSKGEKRIEQLEQGDRSSLRNDGLSTLTYHVRSEDELAEDAWIFRV